MRCSTTASICVLITGLVALWGNYAQYVRRKSRKPENPHTFYNMHEGTTTTTTKSHEDGLFQVESSFCMLRHSGGLLCRTHCEGSTISIHSTTPQHITLQGTTRDHYKITSTDKNKITLKSTGTQQQCTPLPEEAVFYYKNTGIRTEPLNFTVKAHTNDSTQFCFAHLGDWGAPLRPGKTIALAISKIALKHPLWGVISAGDNFYPSGVKNISDPQLLNTFERQYSGSVLNLVPWYAVLGNHDVKVKSSRASQIEYTNVSRRWNMPASSYFLEKHLLNGVVMCFGFVDTNSESDLKTNQLFSIGAEFRERNCVLKIVVGHNPVFSGGAVHGSETGKKHWKAKTKRIQKILIPFLLEHSVHMYLSGDDHSLQIVRSPLTPTTTYFVSGASGGTFRFHPARQIPEMIWHSKPRQFGWMRHCANTTHVLTYVHGGSEVLFTYVTEF